MPSSSPARITNALSVDVEDYFQVQALESSCPRSQWESYESRVARNTDRVLELFEQAQVRATFFTLGWVGERHRDLVRRIAAGGHEVASHGYAHVRVDRQTPEEFRRDVGRTRRLLEDISGVAVRGYRAPTFSINADTGWAWRVLEEEGYAYSSSVYPVVRDFYGSPDAPRTAHRPWGAEALVEIPIATVRLGHRNWPCGGGGYFRLLPYAVSRAAISRINGADGQPAVFYIHPWELDPDQPRPRGAPLKSRIRHYLNLAKTAERLARLARDFRWDRIDRVFDLDGTQGQASRAAAPAA